MAKARKYCAFQEHCTFDIRRKLVFWEVDSGHFNKIIDELKKENYLSDQRFAELFARSKVNQKKWGRIKIAAELKKHEISDQIISEALKAIPMDQYYENLEHLALKKEKELSETDSNIKKTKLKLFLYSKGYEPEMIFDFLKNQNY